MGSVIYEIIPCISSPTLRDSRTLEALRSVDYLNENGCIFLKGIFGVLHACEGSGKKREYFDVKECAGCGYSPLDLSAYRCPKCNRGGGADGGLLSKNLVPIDKRLRFKTLLKWLDSHGTGERVLLPICGKRKQVKRVFQSLSRSGQFPAETLEGWIYLNRSPGNKERIVPS
jgi:hypothetical protein